MKESGTTKPLSPRCFTAFVTYGELFKSFTSCEEDAGAESGTGGFKVSSLCFRRLTLLVVKETLNTYASL